ncbi:MAG: hypothetical protein R2941_17265 [Desulfobacterales bacterium]
MKENDPNHHIAFSALPVVKSRVQETEKAFSGGAEPYAFFETEKGPRTSAIPGGMGSPKAAEKLLRLYADSEGSEPEICLMQAVLIF